jgi:tRNA(Ile)-lysidine synthase TilS/MesJ
MIDFNNSNKIYHYLKSSAISLHRINGLDIPFDNKWKKIGINLSGGADSACLLLLLCNLFDQFSLQI